MFVPSGFTNCSTCLSRLRALERSAAKIIIIYLPMAFRAHAKETGMHNPSAVCLKTERRKFTVMGIYIQQDYWAWPNTLRSGAETSSPLELST